MGFFKKLKSKSANETSIECIDRSIVYVPVAGEIMPLHQIADGVFSEGILGKGCCIKPSDGIVVAPFDGEITQLAETKHAIGMHSDSGIELLIHVGLDTVDMNGRGFKPLIKKGDKVKCGQRMMTFSIEEIENTEHPTTTVVVVTNSDDYTDVVLTSSGFKQRSEELLRII